MVFLGSLLILLGVFWLLRNLGFISADFWGVFWPTALILIGIRLLWPSPWRKFWTERGGKKIKIE